METVKVHCDNDLLWVWQVLYELADEQKITFVEKRNLMASLEKWNEK